MINAIHAKTGLVTYHGALFSFLGYDDAVDNRAYTDHYIDACLMKSEDYRIMPSEQAVAYEVVQEGFCEGKIVGGNLCTLNLLQGTEFMPELKDTILFIEDNNTMGDYFVQEFDRNLQNGLADPKKNAGH